MRLTLVLLVLLGGWFAPLATAQVPSAPAAEPAAGSYAAGTGDAWIDAQLADINLYAQRYPESFLDELVRYGGISYPYVEALLKQAQWPAGDIYLACFLGKALELGCRPLVRALAAGGGQGWAAALERAGIEPGRLHWRAVRHGMVDSYARWDRPITPDAVLRRQLAEKVSAGKSAGGR